MPDLGVRRSGMLANTANPDDPTAVFHNAAGLSEQALSGTQVYAAFTGALPRMFVRLYDSQGTVIGGPTGSYSPTLSFAASPFVALATDRPAEWVGVKGLAAGLAFYVPNAMGAWLPSCDDVPLEQSCDAPTRFHMVQGYTIAGFGTGALSWRINDFVTVGASASMVYARMYQDKVLSALAMIDPDSRFNPDADRKDEGRQVLTASGWAPSFAGSLLLHVPGGLTIGLVADTQSTFDLTGTVSIDAKATGVAKQTVGHHTDLGIPWDLKVGLNWEPPFLRGLHLAADFRHWHYSSFQDQTTAFDEPVTMLGGKTKLVSHLGYVDSKNVAVGASYRVNERWEIMAGGQNDWSPVPEGQGLHTVSNLSADLWGVCAGVLYLPSDRTRLGIAVLHNWFAVVDQKTSSASPPENFRFDGHNWEFIVEGGHAF